MYKFNPNNRLV